MATDKNGKEYESQQTPYFLDLGEVRHAIEMLRPGLGPDETETLMDVLMSMQATSFRERVVYELPAELALLDQERPDWLHEERARIGIIG